MVGIDLSIIENGDVNPLDNNVVDSEVIVPRSEVQVERNILDPDPSKLVDDRSFVDMVKDDGVISATGEVISQGIDDFKNITPGEIAEQVTSRVESMPLDAMAMAGTQEMAKGLGWEVGDQNTSIFYMTNKVIWITGGSSGIGKSLAYKFANENRDLFLNPNFTLAELTFDVKVLPDAIIL